MIRKSKPKKKNIELLYKFLKKKYDLVPNKYTKQDHKL
jgi:hypothetical protein